MYDDNINNNAMSPGRYQIANGATVYDAAGEKVGTVAEYDPQAGYMLVEKGWLFHKDIYIPLDAITNSDDNGIYLQLYKDDLKQDRFGSPPVASASTTSTTYGTTEPGMVNTGGSTYVNDTGTNAADYTGPATGVTNDAGYAATGTGAAYDTTRTVDTTDTTGATDWDRSGQPIGQTSQAEDIRIPVREEELVVGKERQEAGHVHVHKEVIEEPANVNVPLRREHVSVERAPYSGDVTTDADAFKETDIDVPVMGEKAVVGKRVKGAEEVRIHKDVIDDNQQVSDTVRKERVVVDDQTQPDQTYTERQGYTDRTKR